MEQLGRPFDIKEVSETGSFEGLASVYGNVDLGLDIIEPGAFKEFYRTKDGKIRILDGHNPRVPIGKGEVIDSHLGLVIKGQLVLETGPARNVHALMKAGVIDGLSVGYDILPGGSKIDDQGVRHLSSLKLWEVSATPFPMNPKAQVLGVKNIERVRSVRELEELLRESVGLSNSQAVKHAGEIWRTLSGQRESGVADEFPAEAGKQLLDLFHKFS